MRLPVLDPLPTPAEMAAGYSLDTCGAEDADELAGVLCEAFEDPTWTAARVGSALLQAPDVSTAYAVRCPQIVATASTRYLPDRFPGSGYLHWVAVAPAFRGRRLGEAVSIAVLKECARLGRKDVWLETDDFRLAAIRTYLRLGFKPVCPDAEMMKRWRNIFDILRVDNDPPASTIVSAFYRGSAVSSGNEG